MEADGWEETVYGSVAVLAEDLSESRTCRQP